MRGHATGRGGVGWGKDHTKAWAIFNSVYGLPNFCGLDRGAGSWSRQSGPALNGTTFITLGTAEDEPRWDYGGGLEGLLIEPTRINILTDSNFADAGANNVPDNWTLAGGVAGTDFRCVAGGPHGGMVFEYLDTAQATPGCQRATTVAPATDYVSSFWARRASAGATSLYTRDGGGETSIALDAAVHDWKRYIGAVSGSGAGHPTAYGGLLGVGNPDGVIGVIGAQVEAGDCATSWAPSSGGQATRAAELLTIDPSVVGRYRGDVQLKYRFDYPSTQSLTVRPCLFHWVAGYEVVFDPADDKVKVVVGGVDRAETAALTFARQSWHDIRVIYGASGQRLIVDGVATTNSTAWGDPGVLAPYLNSRAASVNCRPGAIGRFTSAWL